MQEKIVTIKNRLGLHARPAAQMVQTASRFKSRIKLLRDDQEVDGKSIMGIMTLAASHGSTVKIVVDGPDETDALNTLVALFESGFGEE